MCSATNYGEEIERLRAELAAVREQRDALRRVIDRLTGSTIEDWADDAALGGGNE